MLILVKEKFKRGLITLLTTVSEILHTNGVCLEDTPHGDISDYPIEAGDFFDVKEIDAYKSNFSALLGYEKEIEPQTKTLYDELHVLTSAIGQVKKNGRTDDGGERLRSLRMQKRELKETIERITREYYRSKPEKYVITYRDMLVANSMNNIAALFPQLGQAKHGRVWEMPIFTKGLDRLNSAALENAGVLGGPCLFGADEMSVNITHSSGEKYEYDFATCKNISGFSLGLAEHFTHFADIITRVDFDNRKRRLTIQEYESLAYPMEFASILDIPFVFPIPDISYKKFLLASSSALDAGVRGRMLDDFTQETNRIADIHIGLFHSLLRHYPLRRYTVLHGREPGMLEHFYEKREKYFRSKKRREKYTSQLGKAESIYDYVSFIAAPFYFWDTPNILQFDVIRETDSMKKCADAHGNVIEIFGFLYSGHLSKNGVETNYDAKQQDKIYMEEV